MKTVPTDLAPVFTAMSLRSEVSLSQSRPSQREETKKDELRKIPKYHTTSETVVKEMGITSTRDR